MQRFAGRFVIGLLLLICPGLRAQTTQPTLGKPAPDGAIVLFDGKDTSRWQGKAGAEPKWEIVDGAWQVTAKTGDVTTKDTFEDFTLHLEFRTPTPAEKDKGQHRGNSGVIILGRYEIQVLESFGLPASTNDCGAVYSFIAPTKNMALPPLQWQSYDITFRAPRHDKDGKKTENARVTLIWNGEKVHDNVEIKSFTRRSDHDKPEPPGGGPIVLQDHGFAVQYKNIWIVPTPKE